MGICVFAYICIYEHMQIYVCDYIYMHVHMNLNPSTPPHARSKQPSQEAKSSIVKRTWCAFGAYEVLSQANLPQKVACHQWTFRQAAFL